MRDEQVRRYARHLALPEVGGLGQTALLVATARVDLREPDPTGELLAAAYLAAGGTGTIVVGGATPEQRAALAAHGPDTQVRDATDPDPDAPRGRPLELTARPAWWPSADGDDVALAYWRAGAAATRWMGQAIGNR
jgi:hypothetical protein